MWPPRMGEILLLGKLTYAGWAVMLLSTSFVCGLLVFCFSRVLRKPHSTEHMHGPLDIDTHDQGT